MESVGLGLLSEKTTLQYLMHFILMVRIRTLPTPETHEERVSRNACQEYLPVCVDVLENGRQHPTGRRPHLDFGLI